jgi:hypothetical protein
VVHASTLVGGAGRSRRGSVATNDPLTRPVARLASSP